MPLIRCAAEAAMHPLLLMPVCVCHVAERWPRVAFVALSPDAVHAVHACHS